MPQSHRKNQKLISKIIGKSIKEKVSIEFYRILSSINTVLGMNKNKPVKNTKPKQLSLFKIKDFA